MDKEERKVLKRKIEDCLDLVLDKNFPLQLAMEYTFLKDDTFTEKEIKNSQSGEKQYSFIDMINLDFHFKTDLSKFCIFSEKQKEWYFVFLEILSPDYFNKPDYSHFTVRNKDQGILPDLEEKLEPKIHELDMIDREICSQYIPVLNKFRKIIKHYCLEKYKNYSLSSASSSTVFDVFNGIYYYFFWDEKLDPDPSHSSALKTFYERFPDTRIGLSTLYRLKNRIIPRILLELEQNLQEREFEYLSILLLLSETIDIIKEGRNTLYKVQYFLKSCPFSLEKLNEFIFK